MTATLGDVLYRQTVDVSDCDVTLRMRQQSPDELVFAAVIDGQMQRCASVLVGGVDGRTVVVYQRLDAVVLVVAGGVV